jgi:hypothetical protein
VAPLLANAGGATGGDPCTKVTDTTEGAAGGATPAAARTAVVPGGAATPADPTSAAGSGSGGSGSSLAFTGSAAALLTLVGFGLILSGAVVMWLRRFGRRLV